MTGCILLLSLSGLAVGAVSVGRTLAVLAILLFARYGYVKGGTVAGVATGAVFALADKQWLFLSAGYSLSGLIGGLLAPMGKAAVVFSALVCGTMFAFAVPERSALLSVALETAVASVIFLILPKDWGNFLSAAFSDDSSHISEEALRRNVAMRLGHCSKALENVGSCVNAVSDRLSRLYEPTADGIYERAAQDACGSCGLRAFCWEKQREMTLDDLRRLTPILKESGSVTAEDIEERFVKRCCKTAELARGVNRSYREYLSMEAARRRVGQVRSVVAGQFAGLSDILRDLSTEFSQAEGYDTDCADRVIRALQSAGLSVVDCACRPSASYGMTVERELATSRRSVLSSEQLCREVSRACGRRFREPVISFEGDRARAVMSEMPLFDLEIGSGQHVCDNGELCGDCLNYFHSGTGSVIAMISDGMGSGGRAAVDSNMAVSIMTKLCKAGLSYDCSLAVVNAALMIKSEEESLATLDVADFNCFTGRLRLLKAGACTTFVIRSGTLLRKDTPSLPLGILNEARFAGDDVVLSGNDLVVMVSDGALPGSPDWIEKLLLSRQESGAEELAAQLVEQARIARRDTRDDDITALVMRVIENA